jgi:hypothetical protein
VLGSAYRLVGWRPQLAPAELLLELAAAGNEPPRQGAFTVQLTPAQITDVRLVGLRGVAP